MTDLAVKRLEIAAYAAILVMAVAVSGTALNKYLKQRTSGKALVGRPSVPSLDRIKLQGADWKAHRHTLLLVLSTTCHFCTESAQFYRKLAEDKVLVKRMSIIAFFPQPVPEGKVFMSTHGIIGVEVRQAAAWEFGLSSTPAVLLVDEHGKVLESWFAKLEPDQEAAVTARLRGLS